ncbi:MAG: alpha/beta hydrolase [Deinococcota bacterium]
MNQSANKTDLSISTILGDIAIKIESAPASQTDTATPIVFLHGLFLDKTLWDDFDTQLTHRTHIYVDMPAHGQSSNVGRNWQLEECVTMLINILDELELQHCIIVGHSWGGMTALRLAHQQPDRVAGLLLLNTPWQMPSKRTQLGFQFQKLLTPWQRFYAAQAAKSLYTKQMLTARPELISDMQARLAKRPAREISRVLDAVILDPQDARSKLVAFSVPTVVAVGEADYVQLPSEINPIYVETHTLSGGHISPHEASQEVQKLLTEMLAKLEPNHEQANVMVTA